ncbi:hypothetical protein JAAARDRAFT_30362 [Jaapia argillacea MUCL 33604]|uniref:Uncharacterized protein n=1 Tax=Jaapia argillacea MUCL 33604 TaxID=933084 RepID=A0A067QG47_9AGAM|nr:hypothetical protein JAAARDRAFT_30362 [Jaapia argillacea MUCL 33604]
MIGRFIPHPLLTLAAIITAVVTSICIRAIWAKVVNLRGSMGRVEGARDGSSAV